LGAQEAADEAGALSGRFVFGWGGGGGGFDLFGEGFLTVGGGYD